MRIVQSAGVKHTLGGCYNYDVIATTLTVYDSQNVTTTVSVLGFRVKKERQCMNYIKSPQNGG